MKVVVIGATGMVGRRLVAEASYRGHQVAAAARRPHSSSVASVTALSVDVEEPALLDAAVLGADAIILAIRPHAGEEWRIGPLTAAVLDAAARAGAPLLVIGGAGALRSPSEAGGLVVDDDVYVPTDWRAVAMASVDQLRACEAHENARWAYLSPPANLEPGVRSGEYRRGTTMLLTDADGRSRIDVEDLAVAALDEIESPGADRHFTVVEDAS